jgi:hypothetical protein
VRVLGGHDPQRAGPAGAEQRFPVGDVVAGRVVGMRTEHHRRTEQDPRFHPGAGDSGQLNLAHPGRGLPVQFQPVPEIAGGERQLGLAHDPEGVPAERRRARGDLVHPAELVRRVREPALADRAEHQQGAQLQFVVTGTDPLHHRQGDPGVLDRRRVVTDVHGQLGQHGVRHRPRPGAVLVPDEVQDALGGLDRAGWIAGVLALVTEPLAGGGGRVPVRIGSQRHQPGTEPGDAGLAGGVGRQPVREAARPGRVVREQHPDQAREVHVAARIGTELAQHGHQRAVRPALADHHRVVQGDRHRRPGGVRQVRRGEPAADRLGDRPGQDDQPEVLAAHRPEQPEGSQQRHERVAVAVGDRGAQFVGQVGLLGADRVDRRELAGARQARLMGGRVADGPAALGGAGAGVLAGRPELHPAELADGLQHPVADPGPGLGHAQQRLVDEAADRVEGTGAEHDLRRLERETVLEQRQPPQGALLAGVQQVPGPLDDREQGLVPVGSTAVAAAQQREPVLEPPVDLLDRHGAHPGRGELDRQRQAVEPADDTGHDRLGETHARSRGDRPLAEQLGRVARLQFAERVDALGGDRQRGPAGGEDAQVGRGRDQEGGELGRRLDQVLAVVQDQQARGLREPLRDPGPDVGPLLGGQGPVAADRVTDAEDGPDFDRDILVGGDAGQLDEVDDRLRRVPGERVRQPRLAQAAGPDDGHHPRPGHQGPQPRQVGVPADQLGRVVAHPPAHRAVERKQAAVRALQQLTGIRAEPLAQVPAVALEPVERRRRAADRGLAAQQVREQRFVLR